MNLAVGVGLGLVYPIPFRASPISIGHPGVRPAAIVAGEQWHRLDQVRHAALRRPVSRRQL